MEWPLKSKAIPSNLLCSRNGQFLWPKLWGNFIDCLRVHDAEDPERWEEACSTLATTAPCLDSMCHWVPPALLGYPKVGMPHIIQKLDHFGTGTICVGGAPHFRKPSFICASDCWAGSRSWWGHCRLGVSQGERPVDWSTVLLDAQPPWTRKTTNHQQAIWGFPRMGVPYLIAGWFMMENPI